MADTAALKAYATTQAESYGIPSDIFLNMIGAESSWNPNAVSSAGAEGIAQLMPGTANNINRFDPYASIHFAAQLLKEYYDKYGTWEAALSAYNAGPSGNWQNSETQNYVGRILGKLGLSSPIKTGTVGDTMSTLKIVFWSAAVIVGIIVIKGVSKG